jgi:hypothetical protein
MAIYRIQHDIVYNTLDKIAEGVSEEIEDELQLIVSTAEQSVKMEKELKQMILITVSTLRELIVELYVSRDSKTD